MNAMRNLASCSCRRRTLISRAFPVVLQLLLFAIIWLVLKSQIPITVQTKDITETTSSEKAEKSQSLPADLTKAKTLSSLSLSSILSPSEATEPGSDGHQNRYLAVNVYVHDAERGSLFLYPSGTLLKLDLSQPKEQQDAKDDIKQFQNKDNMANEDYASNDYDNYDAGGHDYKTDLDDSGSSNVVYNSKELSINKVNSVPLADESTNQPSVNHALKISEIHNNAVAMQQNSIQKTLTHNHIQGSGPEEQIQEYDIDEGQTEGVFGQNIQGNQKGISSSDHEMQKSPSNVGVQNANMNILKIPPKSIESMTIMSQNLNQSQEGRNIPQVGQQDKFEYQTEILPKIVTQNLKTQYDDPTRESSPNIQQWKAPMSEAGSPFYKSALPFSGNIDQAMTEGFADRAKRFLFELHGGLVEQKFVNNKTLNFLLMNNPLACQDFEVVDLVYLITTKAQSSDLRQRIRETFVNSTYFQPHVIVHVFIVGKTTSTNFQQSLNHEQELHGDILQGDFLDAPENSALKGLTGMHWVLQFCPRAKYIMAINEDVFVDTDKLIHGLIPATEKASAKNKMLCYFNPESPIPRSGPKAVDEHVFPGRLNLRPYCKGFAVLMTRGVITGLFAASHHVQPFYMDELYLYGILPFVAGGIEVFDVGNKRAFHNFGMETVLCYQRKLDMCSLVATLAFSERFTTLWDFVKARVKQQDHVNWQDQRSLWDIQSYVTKF